MLEAVVSVQVLADALPRLALCWKRRCQSRPLLDALPALSLCWKPWCPSRPLLDALVVVGNAVCKTWEKGSNGFGVQKVAVPERALADALCRGKNVGLTVLSGPRSNHLSYGPTMSELYRLYAMLDKGLNEYT